MSAERSTAIVRVSQSYSKKLPLAFRQPAPVNQLASELELLVDSNDEQLLEIALTLDEHVVVALLGGNGLHLDQLAGDGAVGPSLMAPVSAQPELNLTIDLAEFTPDLQVPACVSVMALCAVHQVLQDLELFGNRVREALPATELLLAL